MIIDLSSEIVFFTSQSHYFFFYCPSAVSPGSPGSLSSSSLTPSPLLAQSLLWYLFLSPLYSAAAVDSNLSLRLAHHPCSFSLSRFLHALSSFLLRSNSILLYLGHAPSHRSLLCWSPVDPQEVRRRRHRRRRRRRHRHRRYTEGERFVRQVYEGDTKRKKRTHSNGCSWSITIPIR